jgi:squalene-associated FAD-dependent desaturase
VHRADAIVVGAGCAGLAAATSLAERGVRVLMFEARPTVGGRATAFTDPATGERVDNGQHVLLGCYVDTFAFLDRIGARDRVELQDRLAMDIVDGDGRASRLSCPAVPPPFHLLAGLMMWRALTWRDKVAALGIGRMATARPNETVRQWLVRLHQTSRLIELLWEPLAVAALNQSIDVAAAAPFARVLREMLGGGPRGASIAVPLTPLDHMYALPAVDYIAGRGGEVRTSSPATIVCSDLSGPRVIARNEMFTAQHVICAVPWYALGDVLREPPAALRPVIDAARQTAASPIVTVNLWFDRVVTEHALVGMPGRTMQWVFDKRRVFGERASHLSLVSSGAEKMVAKANDELIELAVREIKAALPAARAAQLRRALVVREKHATFSVAPGQPPRPATRTPVAGLSLAGDWIDTGLPATIESAVRSGHMAASLAIVDS